MPPRSKDPQAPNPRPRRWARKTPQPRPPKPRAPDASLLLHERRYDEAAVGLLALAVGLHVVTALQVLVDNLALERAHRLEGNGPALVDSRLCRLVRRGTQGD